MIAFTVLGFLFWSTGLGYMLWSLHDQRRMHAEVIGVAERIHQDRLDIVELLKAAGIEVLHVDRTDLE